jgi:heat shock protein 15
VSYPQARTAYDDRTPERPRVHIPIAMRERGSGRPTKKERRELDRLRGYDSHEHY